MVGDRDGVGFSELPIDEGTRQWPSAPDERSPCGATLERTQDRGRHEFVVRRPERVREPPRDDFVDGDVHRGMAEICRETTILTAERLQERPPFADGAAESNPMGPVHSLMLGLVDRDLDRLPVQQSVLRRGLSGRLGQFIDSSLSLLRSTRHGCADDNQHAAAATHARTHSSATAR